MTARYVHDDDRLLIHKTADATDALHRARMLRDSGNTLMSDSVCVGSVPIELVAKWAIEAGVSWDDTEALEDVVMRKLMDGEFAKFRVYEGNV